MPHAFLVTGNRAGWEPLKIQDVVNVTGFPVTGTQDGEHAVTTVAAIPCDRGWGGGYAWCRKHHSLSLRQGPRAGYYIHVHSVANVTVFPCNEDPEWAKND